MGDGSGSRTLAVPLDWTLPTLGRRVVPDGGRVDVSTTAESITVHDTADADLAAVGVSLHHVVDPHGAQWRVQVGSDTSVFPDAPGRGVPAEIRDLLLGARAGAALRIVRRVERTGTVHRVIDVDDAELGTVTVVHDRTAVPSARAAELTERQYVVVAGWAGPFVAAVTRRLGKCGAEPETPDDEPDAETVGAAFAGYFAEQHTAMARADLDLRLGEDAVHRFRVAIRRMRSAVRVVDIATDEQAARLDAELKWLSEMLGAVRDRQVLREHLLPADLPVDRVIPDELVSALAHVDRTLRAEDDAARSALSAALSGRRYVALLKALRAWRTTPPFTSAAGRPVERLARYLSAADKKLGKRLSNATSPDDLHRARKAAKRARYVADLAGPHAGKSGSRVARHAKALQTKLGDHQDCVMAAEFLHRAAQTAPSDAAFGCGVLWEREQQRAARLAAAAVT